MILAKPKSKYFFFLLNNNTNHSIRLCIKPKLRQAIAAKHAVLRRKSKNWLAQNQNKVCKWSDMSYPRSVVSLRQHYINPSKRVGLVQSEHHRLIEMQLFLAKIYSEKCVLGIKQQSLTRSQPFLCNIHSLAHNHSSATITHSLTTIPLQAIFKRQSTRKTTTDAGDRSFDKYSNVFS